MSGITANRGGYETSELLSLIRDSDKYAERIETLRQAKMEADESIALVAVASEILPLREELKNQLIEAKEVRNEAMIEAKRIVDKARQTAERLTQRMHDEAEEVLKEAKTLRAQVESDKTHTERYHRDLILRGQRLDEEIATQVSLSNQSEERIAEAEAEKTKYQEAHQALLDLKSEFANTLESQV